MEEYYTTTKTTTVYLSKVAFPSVLGSTSSAIQLGLGMCFAAAAAAAAAVAVAVAVALFFVMFKNG